MKQESDFAKFGNTISHHVMNVCRHQKQCPVTAICEGIRKKVQYGVSGLISSGICTLATQLLFHNFNHLIFIDI